MVPATLSFVAGYVDSYTFLALFGLFVAQVTGSFVIGGAELVTHDTGIAGKLIAIVAFLVAAALTAGLIGWLRHARPRGLAVDARLRDRAARGVHRRCSSSARRSKAPATGTASSPACSAPWRWARRACIVRLLMRGIPQTNVMTGNMTQLGISSTELFLAWRRYARDPGDPTSERQFIAVRSQLAVVLAIAVGFLLGAACGAVAFAKLGLPGAPLAVVAGRRADAVGGLARRQA